MSRQMRLLQLIARCLLAGTGNMGAAEIGELKELIDYKPKHLAWSTKKVGLERFCGCGCGGEVSKPGNKFIRGHATRSR